MCRLARLGLVLVIVRRTVPLLMRLVRNGVRQLRTRRPAAQLHRGRKPLQGQRRDQQAEHETDERTGHGPYCNPSHWGRVKRFLHHDGRDAQPRRQALCYTAGEFASLFAPEADAGRGARIAGNAPGAALTKRGGGNSRLAFYGVCMLQFISRFLQLRIEKYFSDIVIKSRFTKGYYPVEKLFTQHA
jgi:hypothetical protein